MTEEKNEKENYRKWFIRGIDIVGNRKHFRKMKAYMEALKINYQEFERLYKIDKEKSK